MTKTLLRIDGLSKAYPGVRAVEDVSFHIKKGEIHALLGENGAGKSTLVKMIYGLVRPDRGTMTWDSTSFAPIDPRAARGAGVAMVFQHFSLFDALSVAENIMLGMEKPSKRASVSAQIQMVSGKYGLPLDPNRIVGDLSAGERQRVEIIRCLLQNPKLLIMDEPTSVLTPQEVGVLFDTLRRLSARDVSILYISHKLNEISALCDTATILRGGKKVATCDPRQKSPRDLAEMMVGDTMTPISKAGAKAGDLLLKVQALSVPPQSNFGTALHDIALELHRGEILGIGGVAGNGQDELICALSGEIPATGKIVLSGQDISSLSPNSRRSVGLLSAPEERLGHAAAPDMTLVENTILTSMVRQKMMRWGVLNWRKARDFAQQIIATFDVRPSDAKYVARALSGGNLQKFVIGREISQAPQVLIVNQPTWGVDAAAASAIRKALLDLAANGAAIIVISQDLEELMEISTRFMALSAGRLSRAHEMMTLSLEDIGLMLGGADVLA